MKPFATLEIDQVASPRIHRLHSYWRQKCGAALLPRRADIAPDEIRDLLPYIMIVDVERDPLRFRYRLVGTKVVEYNGVEFTGRYLGDIGWPEEPDLIDSYTKVVQTRRPVFGVLAWEQVSGAIGRCEFARLPLSEDGELVSQILGMEDYDFLQPDAVPSGGQAKR